MPNSTPLPSDVTALRETLCEVQAYLNHWSEDKWCNLMPSDTTLEYVRRKIARALLETQQ